MNGGLIDGRMNRRYFEKSARSSIARSSLRSLASTPEIGRVPGRSAAENRDELAAFQLIEWHSVPLPAKAGL